MGKYLIKSTLILVLFCFMAHESWAIVAHKVSNSTEFQNALTAAESNGDDDIILLAQGTYYGGFRFESDEGCDLVLLGGYSADWSSRVIDPSNTILDGGSSERVLFLRNTGGGGFFISGLTIQNGKTSEIGAGAAIHTISPSYTGHVYIIDSIIQYNESTLNRGGGADISIAGFSEAAGDIYFVRNIIRGNESGDDGAGAWLKNTSTIGPTGIILVQNNIIEGNQAWISGGGGGIKAWISCDEGGTCSDMTFVNNTITNNTAKYGGGINTYSEKGTVNIYNNIIWQNYADVTGDILLGLTDGTYNVYNNNYSDITSIGPIINLANNIDQDPLFIGGSDYHLRDSSPCIDSGTNSAPELPSKDFDENLRIINGDFDSMAKVDMGAYEFYPILEVFDGHDFDGNGTSDVAVWRPTNGKWYIRNGTTHPWGMSGDTPVNGDYDGNNTTDIAVWRPTNGRWYIRNIDSYPWGVFGDIAVPGDYNGDGHTDAAVWRPSNGRWYIRGVGGYVWGTSGDVPVPGDYDGDGGTEAAVWRPTNGRWYIRGVAGYAWGTSGDIPVPGDYDGDGETEAAVWRPSNGRWYIRGGENFLWGQEGDMPVPGDYDGDGITEIAVWRPSNGRWYIKGIGGYIWGMIGDIPLVR